MIDASQHPTQGVGVSKVEVVLDNKYPLPVKVAGIKKT
jgi:hypothetical protein